MSITDQAQQNRQYVRRMLNKKQPEFAAVLESVVGELARMSDAPTAESTDRETTVGGLPISIPQGSSRASACVSD